MKICKKILSAVMTLAIAFVCICSINILTIHAATLDINLKNNQTFYLLPGNEKVEYQVKITSGAQLGNDATYLSDNVAVAAIDSFGVLTIKDAGTAKITVSTGGKKVERTIKILNRTDWTKVVSIKNYEKLTAKKNMCAIKMSNVMDFPVKMVFTYSTFSASNNRLSENVKSKTVYVAAKDTMTYKMYFDDSVKYISISDAVFEYDQFDYKTIATKNVAVKEKISTKKNITTITETITNNNKNKVIVPYMAFVYDKNGKLERIEYTAMVVNGKDKATVKNTYYKTSTLNEYNSKITYQFLTPMPLF